MLNVEVIEARDLPKIGLVGKTHPYCYVWISSRPTHKKKTRTIKKTFAPVWNEFFALPLQDRNLDFFKVQLFNHDRVGKDTMISSLDVQLSSLNVGEIKDDWFDLTPAKSGKDGGQIKLRLHIAPLTEPPFNKRSRNSIEAAAPTIPQCDWNELARPRSRTYAFGGMGRPHFSTQQFAPQLQFQCSPPNVDPNQALVHARSTAHITWQLPPDAPSSPSPQPTSETDPVSS